MGCVSSYFQKGSYDLHEAQSHDMPPTPQTTQKEIYLQGEFKVIEKQPEKEEIEILDLEGENNEKKTLTDISKKEKKVGLENLQVELDEKEVKEDVKDKTETKERQEQEVKEDVKDKTETKERQKQEMKEDVKDKTETKERQKQESKDVKEKTETKERQEQEVKEDVKEKTEAKGRQKQEMKEDVKEKTKTKERQEQEVKEDVKEKTETKERQEQEVKEDVKEKTETKERQKQEMKEDIKDKTETKERQEQEVKEDVKDKTETKERQKQEMKEDIKDKTETKERLEQKVKKDVKDKTETKERLESEEQITHKEHEAEASAAKLTPDSDAALSETISEVPKTEMNEVDIQPESKLKSPKAEVSKAEITELKMEEPKPEPESRESEEEHDEKEELIAATKIQAGFRGYKVRKDLSDKRQVEEKKSEGEKAEVSSSDSDGEDLKTLPPAEVNDKDEEAAVRIQATYRGYKVRKELSPPKKAEETPSTLTEEETLKNVPTTATEIDEQELKAATTIQSAFRGYQVRKDLKPTEEKITDVTEEITISVPSSATNEEIMKEPFSVETDDQELKAATTIQAAFRGHQVRKKQISVKETPETVLAVSSDEKIEPVLSSETYEEKTMAEPSVDIHDEDLKAATTIQAAYRGYKVRKDLTSVKADVPHDTPEEEHLDVASRPEREGMEEQVTTVKLKAMICHQPHKLPRRRFTCKVSSKSLRNNQRRKRLKFWIWKAKIMRRKP